MVASTGEAHPAPHVKVARRTGLGQQIMALADQGIVSAASFFTLVMVARWADATQVGLYSVAASVVALALSVQDSLVVRPYAIRVRAPIGSLKDHAAATRLLAILVSLVAAGSVAMSALGLKATGSNARLAEVIATLAMALPFLLARDFARRFAFAHLTVHRALLIDTAVAGLTILAIFTLGWAGSLSAVTAFVAIALACAIGVAGWSYAARAAFGRGSHHLRQTAVRNWSIGKWLLASQLAMQSQGYMIYWVSMSIVGPKITGVYAACMSIVAFLNPILFGFLNILTPKYVQIFHSHGMKALRRRAAIDAFRFGTGAAAFCFFILVGGDRIMALLYPGTEFRGYGFELTVLATAALASVIGSPFAVALTSVERVQVVAGVNAGSAVLCMLFVWWLMTSYGLVGAAIGALAAEATGSAALWVTLLGAGSGPPRGKPSEPVIGNN